MRSERTYVDDTSLAVQRVLDARVWQHDGVELRRSTSGLGMYATRRFLPGEVIYSTDLLTVRGLVDNLVARTIVDGRVAPVDVTAEHMVVFEDGRWLDVPGCFANHSCVPNTASVFQDPSGCGRPSVYDQVALVEILPGDQITCDYTRFDWGDDGLEFDCQCGETACYGLIDGFGGLPPHIQEQAADTLAMEAQRRWALLRGQQ
ncbi:MAG TPA: hypothetical protein DCQ36_07420 [Actinobacteria bacterium]|nr:hypothetical protein [Actinomycetota bacterium]